MSKNEQLRSLPGVDELLATVAALVPDCPRSQLVSWIRAAIDECRQQILADCAPEDVPAWIFERIRQLRAADRGQSLQHVINATGVLIHTNLGRAPLAERARQRMLEAAGFSNVELDLQSGRRSKRGGRAMRLLAELTGADDAVVVNNCAAATMLTLQATSQDREVIISRGQLVEIGGGFRLPEVFAAAQVILREVGTTNRTYLRDYENAMTEHTGALIRVHRSNFRQEGFVTEPSIEELAAVPRPENVVVIDDVGSGCIHDLAPWGLHEPQAPASVKAGADVVLFSGDKLFGGPQCGIIVGKQKWIDRLSKHPMMRTLRCDKMTLAALEATTEIHLSGQAFDELPVLAMLSRSPDEIEEACERVLEKLPQKLRTCIEVAPCQSPIGGGTLPAMTLPSRALCCNVSHPDQVAAKLRTRQPAIHGRVVDDRLWLDLRTVSIDEMPALVDGLSQAMS